MTRSAGPAAAPADEAAPARRRRRSSGPRDPLAPKRAHTAFDFFVESRKGALKTANPEIKSAEMIKLLAEEWKAVATADRAPFKAQAAEDRERHEAEMASCVPPASYVLSSVGVAKSGKRLKKDPAKPKRPLTAYIAFLSAERPKLVEKYPDSAGVAALAPKLSAAWAALTPAQRDKYEKQAQADKERFDREMQTYTPSAEYLEAKEQFKQQHGGGGSSTALAEVEAVEVMDEEQEVEEEEVDEDEEQVMEADDDEEEEAAEAPASSLAAENQRLKKAVAKQSRELQQAREEILRLRAQLGGKGKGGGKLLALTVKPGATKTNGHAAAAASSPALPRQAKPALDAHFLEWTTQMIGDESGSGLSQEMKDALRAEGPSSPALVKMLAAKYLSETSGKRPAAAAGKPAKKARK